MPTQTSNGDDVSFDEALKQLVMEKLEELLDDDDFGRKLSGVLDPDDLLGRLTEARDWEDNVQSAADAGTMIEDRVEQELDRRNVPSSDDIDTAIRSHTEDETHGGVFQEDEANSWLKSLLTDFPQHETGRCAMGIAATEVVRTILRDDGTVTLLQQLLGLDQESLVPQAANDAVPFPVTETQERVRVAGVELPRVNEHNWPPEPTPAARRREAEKLKVQIEGGALAAGYAGRDVAIAIRRLKAVVEQACR